MTEENSRQNILALTSTVAHELYEVAGRPVAITPKGLSCEVAGGPADVDPSTINIGLDPIVFENIHNAERAKLVWRGLAIRELASHLWQSGTKAPNAARDAAAASGGFAALFNLLIEEQDARLTISTYPQWRDAIQSATAYSYPFDGQLVEARTTLSAMESTEKYRERWGRFAYRFRSHGIKFFSDDVALFDEALDLANVLRKEHSHDQLFDIARSVHKILSRGIELPAAVEAEEVVAEPASAKEPDGQPANALALIGSEETSVKPAPETEQVQETTADSAAVEAPNSISEHIKGWIKSARQNPRITIAMAQTTIAWAALLVGVFGVDFWNNLFWAIAITVVGAIAVAGTGFLLWHIDLGIGRFLSGFFRRLFSRFPGSDSSSNSRSNPGSRFRWNFDLNWGLAGQVIKWAAIVITSPIWGAVVLVLMIWHLLLTYLLQPLGKLIVTGLRAVGRGFRDSIFYPAVNGVDSLVDRLAKAWSSSSALHMWIALGALTIPVAIVVAIAASVFVEEVKLSFLALGAYGAFVAVIGYLVYRYWKPLKVRVIGEVPLTDLPDLKAMKQRQFINTDEVPWEQISDRHSVAADSAVLASALSQGGSAGDELRQALQKLGVGVTDQEDHSHGESIQVAELVVLDELAFEKEIEKPSPLSLHVDMALDCSQSNEVGFWRGRSFGLNVEEALKDMPFVTQNSSGFTDTDVFEGPLSGLTPSLESGNNDLAMLEEMAQRANLTEAKFKILVMIGDSLPTEGSWGSLQKLARDLRQDGFIPIQVLTDSDSKPAFDLVVELFDDDSVATALDKFTSIVVDEIKKANDIS